MMTRTTIVVSGALANKPGNGGEAWVRMTWATGLRRLGFDVWFIEQIDRDFLAAGHHGGDDSPPAAFFKQVAQRFGFADRSALIDDRGDTVVGPERSELEEIASQAGLLVNISGHLDLPFLFDRFPRRAYIDLDPGFTQFWHHSESCSAGLGGHHHFFTVGLNVGRTSCAVPANGISWRPLPPPVILDEWPVSRTDSTRFTTVASWRGSFGSLEHDGRRFGTKAHEFRRFLALPRHVARPLEIALHIHAGDHRDLTALQEVGWRIVDPVKVAATPDSFRNYVQGSAAEFSVAQGIYVETACGWFSDRTTRYLASGKPALVQDTGFSDHYRVSRGLVAFRTLREAVRGAERIAGDYERHCRAARRLAEAHFDADIILGRFIEQVGVAP